MLVIERIEIRMLSFPLEKPFSNHLYQLNEIHAVEIRVHAANLYGTGFIYGLRKTPYIEAIAHMKQDIFPILFEIIDLRDLKDCWDSFWKLYKKDEKDYHKLTALAAIDIAIWDLYMKHQNISLHHYLGAAKKSVPVYGTTGWLSLSLERLVEECQSYEANDIHAFKIRIGHEDDSLRVSTLREKMGRDFILMLDANSRYSPEEATKVADKLRHFNIFWLEEPTECSSKEMREIKASSQLPIALGENIISYQDFEHICVEKLTDYLQLDLPRCGGITGFIEAAALAKKHNIALCSHLMPQLSASLVAAFPNGEWVEYDNLLPPYIFVSDFSIKNGAITPPPTAGHGVELSTDALRAYTTNHYEVENKVSSIRCRM